MYKMDLTCTRTLQLTSGEEKENEGARRLFIASQINVSSSEYNRAKSYINEYNVAIRQLRQVSTTLQRNFSNDLNLSNLQEFLSNITRILTANVQKLTVKYSPDSVRGYIVYFYQSFLNNLSTNKGAQEEIRDLNLLISRNITSLNATTCIDEYDRKYDLTFSTATSNFSHMVEYEVSVTVSKLEGLRAEIRSGVVNVVNTLIGIITNRESARQQQLDDYVRHISTQLELLNLRFSFLYR